MSNLKKRFRIRMTPTLKKAIRQYCAESIEKDNVRHVHGHIAGQCPGANKLHHKINIKE